MIDTLEKATIQDIAIAKALGIPEREVDRHSLHRMKNEMFNKAFNMREEEKIISQEKADELNKRLEEIQMALCNFDENYDPGIDYIVDFDSFVKNNKQYNRFCW